MFEHWKDFLHPHEGNDHHPYAYRKASVVALACVVGIVLVVSALQTGYIRHSSGFLSSVLPSVLVDMTNESRLEQGLGKLRQNDTLQRAAELKAEHMAENGYFAHDSPSGITPWHWFQKVGYTYQHAGENLAMNFSDSQDVVEAWMESRLHRKNILEKDFAEIGIATAKGEYQGKETIFVVQMFGTPDQRELAQRQNEASAQNSQTNQRKPTADSNTTPQEQTTSTEALLAQLSQQVAEVQESVATPESSDNRRVESVADQAKSTDDSVDTKMASQTKRRNENNPGLTVDENDSAVTSSESDSVVQTNQNGPRGQTTPTDNHFLAHKSGSNEQKPQPELDFATPTRVQMGSVAGKAGVSLAPPEGTAWVAYLLSRPQLILRLAMYTLIGLIMLALIASTAIEAKHYHFWQASVSFVAVLLIVLVYLFAHDLLFVETVVAGVN